MALSFSVKLSEPDRHNSWLGSAPQQSGVGTTIQPTAAISSNHQSPASLAWQPAADLHRRSKGGPSSVPPCCCSPRVNRDDLLYRCVPRPPGLGMLDPHPQLGAKPLSRFRFMAHSLLIQGFVVLAILDPRGVDSRRTRQPCFYATFSKQIHYSYPSRSNR